MPASASNLLFQPQITQPEEDTMKAARAYKQQWEEANWLRLIYIADQISLFLYKLIKKAVIVINVFLYIIYQALKAIYLIIKLLLLTEPGLNRIERDETWIFRQIK